MRLDLWSGFADEEIKGSHLLSGCEKQSDKSLFFCGHAESLPRMQGCSHSSGEPLSLLPAAEKHSPEREKGQLGANELSLLGTGLHSEKSLGKTNLRV